MVKPDAARAKTGEKGKKSGGVGGGLGEGEGGGGCTLGNRAEAGAAVKRRVEKESDANRSRPGFSPRRPPRAPRAFILPL